MAPWHWKNPCTSGSTDSDESSSSSSSSSSQSTTPVHHKHTLYHGKRLGPAQPPNTTGAATNIFYQNPNLNTTTKYCTPVLFSTNRGLHLRVGKNMSKNGAAAATGAYVPLDAAGNRCEDLNTNEAKSKVDGDLGSDNSLHTNCDYDIHFCDLERWSTNRANTICLEDTFIVTRRDNNRQVPSPHLNPNGLSVVDEDNSNGILNARQQRSGSLFYVPSGSRHALVMPLRSLYQRSTSIQSNFERFGLH